MHVAHAVYGREYMGAYTRVGILAPGYIRVLVTVRLVIDSFLFGLDLNGLND